MKTTICQCKIINPYYVYPFGHRLFTIKSDIYFTKNYSKNRINHFYIEDTEFAFIGADDLERLSAKVVFKEKLLKTTKIASYMLTKFLSGGI